MRAYGYGRRSTSGQDLTLESQRAELEAECARRGWELVAFGSDTRSGRSRRRRPGLAEAVRACREGEADVLLAAKLDRLARSSADFSDLLSEAAERGFAVAVLDFAIDTTTATGRLVADIVARVAQWEREMVGERTRAALAVKRAGGWDPRTHSLARAERCEELRADGLSMRAIARETGLHREQVRRALACAEA